MARGRLRSAAFVTLCVAALAAAPACNGGGTQPTPAPTSRTPAPKTPRPSAPGSPTATPASPTPTPVRAALRGRLRGEVGAFEGQGLGGFDGRAIRLNGRSGAGIRTSDGHTNLPGLLLADFSTAMGQTVGTRYALAQSNGAGDVRPVAGMVVVAFALGGGGLIEPGDGRVPFAITGADGTFVLPLPAGDLGPLLVLARAPRPEPRGGEPVVDDPLDSPRLAFGAIARAEGREVVLDEEARVTTLFLQQRAQAALRTAWEAEPAARDALARIAPDDRARFLRRAGDRLLAATALDGPQVPAFGAALAGLRAAVQRRVGENPLVLAGPEWPTPAPTPAEPLTMETRWPAARRPGPADVLDQVVLGWLADGALDGAAATAALATLGTPPVAAVRTAAAGLDGVIAAALPGVAAALRAALEAEAGPAPTPTPIKLGSTPRPSPSTN